MLEIGGIYNLLQVVCLPECVSLDCTWAGPNQVSALILAIVSQSFFYWSEIGRLGNKRAQST